MSLVTEQLGDAVEQTDTCRPDYAVGGVARREDQDPRAAQLIDKAVNLAVAPALRDANRLFRRPPSAASAAMRFDMRAVESHSFRRFSRFGRRLEWSSTSRLCCAVLGQQQHERQRTARQRAANPAIAP
jgi:hypothetical protein